MSSNLTRRAVLRGSAVAAAAATVTTLPIATAVALPDPDPVLQAWRAWRPLEEEAQLLMFEKDRIGETLPEWAVLPSTWVGPGRLPIFDLDMYEELSEIYGPSHQQLMRKNRANVVRRLQRAQAKARAYKEKVGYTWRRERIKAIRTLQEPLVAAIRESGSASAIAIAALADVGLSQHAGVQTLQRLPHNMSCSIVRTLLPHLPPDMAAALRPIAAARGTIREAYRRAAVA